MIDSHEIAIVEELNLQVIPDTPMNLSLTDDSGKSLTVSREAVAKPRDAEIVYYNVRLERDTRLKICVSSRTYWQQSQSNCVLHPTPIGGANLIGSTDIWPVFPSEPECLKILKFI